MNLSPGGMLAMRGFALKQDERSERAAVATIDC
jgi:hypothetical protein